MTVFTNLFDFINQSKFLSVVIATIVIILSIQLIVYIIRLLGNIRSYIVNKSNSFYLSNQKNKNIGNATLSMNDRIDLTNSILDLITFMINNEIINQMKQYISLNDKYNISDIDKDITKISTIVFNGLSPNIFKDPNLVLTEKYLMEFITKKTISMMVEIVQTHNNNIRVGNQSVGD